MLAALARQLTPDATAVPDAELLDRFVRAADGAAFELLVWRHGAMVWATARRVLGADLAAAEDAAQAAFLALARHAGRVRGGSVGPWLHRVTVRAALDLRARRGRALPPAHPADPSPGPECVAADREERGLIDAAVNALPDRLRAAFVLCELEGRSNADAAALLGCPVGTVESRLTRARQRLRAVLSARGVTPALAVGAAALPASTRAALVSAPGAAAVRALAARAAGGSAGPLRTIAAGLVLAAATVGFGLAGGAPQPPDPPAKAGATADPPLPAADPLPPGAVARLGSSRLRHPGTVHDVAYSADGKYLASACDDRTVRLWDALTGKELFAVRREDGTLDRVGFADGGKTLVAVGTSKKRAAADLWLIDLAKQEVTARHVLPWDRPVTFDARISPDGTRLALAEHDLGYAWIIDVRTGNTVCRQPLGEDDRPISAAFSADGKTVAFGTDAGNVRVYDAATGNRGKVYQEPNARFARVAFSPDGKRIAAADTNAAGVVTWDTATGRRVWRSKAGAFYGLAFSPDGRFLVRNGSNASTLDAGTGNFPGVDGAPGAEFGSVANATCLAVHPGGRVVAFGMLRGPVGVFEIATGKMAVPSADPPHPVQGLRFTPDGKTLHGWGADWYAWDVATGRQTRVTNDDWNYGRPLSPDGRFTARSVYYDSGQLVPGDPDDGTRFEVRDTKTGAVVHSYPASRLRGRRWSEFTPDGDGILSAGRDGTLRIWDVATGKERQSLVGHEVLPQHRAFAPDGTALATASQATKEEDLSVAWNLLPGGKTRRFNEEFPVRVWSLTTGKETVRLNPGVPVGAVAVSRGGARVAALAYTNSAGKVDPRELATVWDAATGRVLARLPQGGDGECLALSPDGRLAAVAPRWKGEVRVYDVDAGVERHLFRHPGPITDLTFAPDGRTLAVAASDTPVTLWDVSGGRR